MTKNELYDIHMRPQYTHPYFRSNATEHEKKFMLRKVDPILLEYATRMHIVAPKTCEKCNVSLKIPELCWREEQNIGNFLCYKCIGILEGKEEMMVHDGCGRWVLKNK